MSKFYERPWQARMNKPYRNAEDMFKHYATAHGWSFANFGFSGGLEEYYKVSAFVRATPDFLISSPKQVLIECKGTSSGDHIKIKKDEIEILGLWQEHQDVVYFIYDWSAYQYVFVPWEEVKQNTIDNPKAKTGEYEDNHRLYYMYPKDKLTWKRYYGDHKPKK